jgi:potassium-transporting ATPase KdpC subunit
MGEGGRRPDEGGRKDNFMYLRQLKTSIMTLLVLTVLTGLVYPLALTAIAQVVFPWQANGSLIVQNGKRLGSHLIGQPFDDPKYFWSRLSATGPAYNASGSSGSNLGPLNPALVKAVQDRVAALRQADPGNLAPIPVDLVTSSASGLDPHITPAAADYQAPRIARLRRLPLSLVRSLVNNHTEGKFLGLLGESRVNVLELNRELDRRENGPASQS